MTIIVNGFLGSLLLTGGYAAGAVSSLVCYVDPRAAQLYALSSDADLFAVDARGATLVVSTSDFQAVDPRAAQLIRSLSDADPFGVDSRGATLAS
jgi:hypothetical protein